jgi:hypothetical protein
VKNTVSYTPDATTGNTKAAHERFGDKRDVGAMAGGLSVRWVDNQLTLGMPHLKIGRRRVRFDLAEVREWLKARYGCARRGPVQNSTPDRKAA